MRLQEPVVNDGKLAAHALLRSSRFSFVILAPICVFLGVATAWSSGASIQLGVLALVLVAAVLAHMSVNLLNEYLDFKSGLDLLTQRTPFSGGTGFLPQQPDAARFVLLHAVITLLLSCAIGCYLVWKVGVGLLPLGFLGAFLVLSYTTVLNRSAWLCLIAPGVGFGGVIVLGAHYAMAGHFDNSVLMAALVTFLLVNNLLLLNQFPDLEADRKSGRLHLLIRHGVNSGVWVYALSVLAIFCIIVASVWLAIWPIWALLVLIPWMLGLFALVGAGRFGAELGAHLPFMAANVVVTLTLPLVLGLVLILTASSSY